MDCDFKTMYECPLCKEKDVEVLSILALFKDVRVDTVSCSRCKAVWKLYQKIVDAHIEITHFPSKEDSSNTKVTNEICNTEDVEGNSKACENKCGKSHCNTNGKISSTHCKSDGCGCFPKHLHKEY